MMGCLGSEEIAKPLVYRALDAATRQTKTKGIYSKGSHGFAIWR